MLNELIQLNLLNQIGVDNALCFRLVTTTSTSLPIKYSYRINNNNNNNNENKHSITHSGVREFTAEEGKIGLPYHLWSNLSLPDPDTSLTNTNIAIPIPNIHIKYIKLPKITHLVVQPEYHAFVMNIIDMKRCLEENLVKYTTLTKDTKVYIWYRGHEYTMIIKKIEGVYLYDHTIGIYKQIPSAVNICNEDMEKPCDEEKKKKEKDTGTDILHADYECTAGCCINANITVDFLESIQSIEYQSNQVNNSNTTNGNKSTSVFHTIGGGSNSTRLIDTNRPVDNNNNNTIGIQKYSQYSNNTLNNDNIKLTTTTATTTTSNSSSNTTSSSSSSASSSSSSAAVVPLTIPVVGTDNKELIRQKRLLALQSRTIS